MSPAAQAGPPLEQLLRRLADTPPDFLDEPWVRDGARDGAGRVHVAALVADLLAELGGQADAATLARFAAGAPPDARNRLALAAVAIWLMADEGLAACRPAPEDVVAFLDGAVGDLVAAAPASRYTSDPERREELARTALRAIGRPPAGETAVQAADRLSAVSAVERRRLLDASRQAEQRAQAVREALQRKAAQEAADKWTRE